MFRQTCSKCNKKIDKSYEYCPFCGSNLVKKEDYGLLGKDDLEEIPNMFGSSMIEKMFQTATKMLEKQMRGMAEEMNKPKNKPQKPHLNDNIDVQFYINGKKVNVGKPKQTKSKQIEPIKSLEITSEQAKRLAKLPRKEPKTKMTRLSDKLIYTLEVPGVNNINDVLINQLENSIEVKAISKTKVYSKTINVNLPIIGYKLAEPKLIVELQAK